MNQDKLQYIPYEEVDTDKWDLCMNNAPNALVYAQSWYLDKVAGTWDALVLGDYRYVMPITYRRKFRVTYLYQPFFCQQLGIFPAPTTDIMQLFYDELVKRFSFAEINLNAMALPLNSMQKEARKNYLLWLNDPYLKLTENYSKHTRRKLKKASKNKLSMVTGISILDYLQFKKENSIIKLDKYSWERLRNLLAFTVSRSIGQIYGVYDEENSLCAAVLFVRYKRRVTYLNAATNEKGKSLNAMYFLIDKFIHEHAGKDYFLDFEGSMIPGVARLYEGFGAAPEIYYRLSWNNLPAYIKWVKK